MNKIDLAIKMFTDLGYVLKYKDSCNIELVKDGYILLKNYDKKTLSTNIVLNEIELQLINDLFKVWEKRECDK